MLSVGAHLVIRLLTFFSVFVALVVLALYFLYGPLGVVTVIGVSGISLLAFFATTWEKVKEPLTERLDYLNQHAYSPLAEWSDASWLDRINPSYEVASNALTDLKTHRRYMTVRLYPKPLLQSVESVVKNTADYVVLWNDIYQRNQEWIQEAHFEKWANYSTMPDMRIILYALGLSSISMFFNPNPEILKLVNGFIDDYKRKNSDKCSRFVSLHKDLQAKKDFLSAMLNGYMRTNMLTKIKNTGLP